VAAAGDHIMQAIKQVSGQTPSLDFCRIGVDVWWESGKAKESILFGRLCVLTTTQSPSKYATLAKILDAVQTLPASS
jgi:hypothetical protein